MSNTITVRLDESLAQWLQETAEKTGVSQGKIVRDQLERARLRARKGSFMRLAGAMKGPKDLSTRKGFSAP
jgi:predicted transcriptional regulator